MSENQLTTQENNAIDCVSTGQLVNQVTLIQRAMQSVMQKDVHYGLIPGCGPKPTLLKPGAEKLGLMFRLAPHCDDCGGKIVTEELGMGHRAYEVHCALVHINTGSVWAVGVGICSTMETKYRFHKAEQVCPTCGKETIIKGKKEYGGGWICFEKRGGCGAKFRDGDPVIENQNMGRIEHDNPADYYNTCLKMAKKRAYVDGILSATAASDIFTQDIEEMVENGVIKPAPVAAPAPKSYIAAPTQKEETPASNLISEAQRKRLYAIAKTAGKTDIEAKAIEAMFGFASSKDITKDRYEAICTEMAKPKQTQAPTQPTTEPAPTPINEDDDLPPIDEQLLAY